MTPQGYLFSIDAVNVAMGLPKYTQVLEDVKSLIFQDINRDFSDDQRVVFDIMFVYYSRAMQELFRGSLMDIVHRWNPLRRSSIDKKKRDILDKRLGKLNSLVSTMNGNLSVIRAMMESNPDDKEVS
jgi:hypothetical protein